MRHGRSLPSSTTSRSCKAKRRDNHLGTVPKPRYGPSHKPKGVAIWEIATMNNQRLAAEIHREKSPAKHIGFGGGVFLQARWEIY